MDNRETKHSQRCSLTAEFEGAMLGANRIISNQKGQKQSLLACLIENATDTLHYLKDAINIGWKQSSLKAPHTALCDSHVT